jgi:hypothetical protein
MRVTILNKSMTYHFIYKTTHQNGKYYIGRHSTENLDDGYIGSGRWPLSIKDKSSVVREIIEFVDDAETLKQREGEYLKEHYGRPGCMNATPDPVGFDTDNNPMKRSEVVSKLSGDNHWSRKNPEKFREQLSGDAHWMNRNPEAKQKFIENHPNRDGRNAKAAMEKGTHVWLANNPSKWRSEQGIHHWQNGNSPNAGGKVNAERIANGTHNFLGPDHNRKMIAEGKNPWVGSEGNLKRLAEGTHPSQMKKTCEHCGKETSVGMYKRWHGNNCKSLKGK